MCARFGDRRQRLTQLLDPLRWHGRVSGSWRRLIPVSKDGAGATPEQRHSDTDDEREDDFERHGALAIVGGAEADEVAGRMR